MEESKWKKQICGDNSIQLLLCEHFIHPTVNDCVVVGNFSFRLIILQSNQIKEVARYDHQKPIVTACIAYNGEQPEIAFISGQTLFFMVPHIDQFEITNTVQLNYKYSFITSNYTLLCLYPRYSSITFYNRTKNTFTNYELESNTKIWSCAFLNEFLLTLEYQNVFKVKIYKINNLDQITSISSFVVNYFVPYKFISVPAHSSVYLLCESVLIQFKKSGQTQSFSGGWTLSKYPIDIQNSDPLLVDAAPCGVRLFVLTAGGFVLLFDGSRIEVASQLKNEFPGASLIASLTISRFLLCMDSCRVKLFDSGLVQLDEVSRAACLSASYTAGNFTVASQFSVHSIFFDYGIEVGKCAEAAFDPGTPVVSAKDCCFFLLPDRTVVIDADFKDVTPSAVKKCHFERVHANSRHSFFAASSTQLFAYEHGSFCVLDEESDLTSHRSNELVAANGRLVTVHAYSRSALLRQARREMGSCVSAVVFADMIYASLFDCSVVVMDSELSEVCCVRFDFIVASIVSAGGRLVFGTDDGRVAFADMHFQKVEFKEKPIGYSSVHLMAEFGEVTAICDSRCFYVCGANSPSSLPPDFIFFSPFLSPGVFVGVVRPSRKAEGLRVVSARFADRSLGIRSKLLYEFSSPVTKMCSSRRGGDIVCCLGKSTLFFSRGDVKYALKGCDEVKSITEWKAKHKARVIQFWMVCAMRNGQEGRLLIFNQSQTTAKVELILEKSFNLPITAFAVSTPSLAFFASGDAINGISLETGALKAKAKVACRISDVVALDSSEKYVAALAERNEFAVFSISEGCEVKIVSAKKKLGLFGRIKVVGDSVVVSSRVCPALFIYGIVINEKSGTESSGDLSLVRQVSLMSPATSLFAVNGNALCVCVCGEVELVSCSSETELSGKDASKVFSFSNSVLSAFE